MGKTFKCPVCGKPLTQTEYDNALGLWKEKQEHIKHLEEEQKKLKELQKVSKEKLEEERGKLKEKEKLYRRQAQKQSSEFRKLLTEQSRKSANQLKEQKERIERLFAQKIKTEIKQGVEKGITEQKKQLKKQETELSKTKHKMQSLENSLKVSARKYDQASEEIKKLKQQIEKGITPQIEGLLEEAILLAKLKELFPQDKFKPYGKGGDILHFVIEHGTEIGKIVYECKKVKTFNKNHIDQAKEARRIREADFAVLVTNAFPSKKQFYFVEKTVFVINPISLEPIIYTLRESLVRIDMLKMTNAAKQKAVQKIYDYLSSNEYNNKINDMSTQLVDLGKELKTEIASHKRSWEMRYKIYSRLYSDINIIDNKLKVIAHDRLESKQKLLPLPQEFVKIAELTI